jgi:hypothetical protein
MVNDVPENVNMPPSFSFLVLLVFINALSLY